MNFLWLTAELLFLLSNALLVHSTRRDINITNLYKWKLPDFDYTDSKRNEVLQGGFFVPLSPAVLDADYHEPTDRYFVTTPQFQKGTPITLSEVIKEKGILKPFPKWAENDSEPVACSNPFSVFRIHIDKCGLMWVPDAGRKDLFGTADLACKPKLLVYDLNNGDSEILRYEFPAGVFTDRTLLVNIITESYKPDCSDSFAYIADAIDYGLIVFDYAKKTSWRVTNQYFYPYPSKFVFKSNDVHLYFRDGIFGLALSPPTDTERKLYFHSLASVQESLVPVRVLKNHTLASDPVILRTAFVTSSGERAGQSTVQVMTDDGILIYALVTANSLVCWNSKRRFNIENQHTLLKDDENFQFITGLKLKNNKLLITSSRLQNYFVGNVNGSDFNYRIMMIEDVGRLLQNTPCTSGNSSERNQTSGAGFRNGDSRAGKKFHDTVKNNTSAEKQNENFGFNKKHSHQHQGPNSPRFPPPGEEEHMPPFPNKQPMNELHQGQTGPNPYAPTAENVWNGPRGPEKIRTEGNAIHTRSNIPLSTECNSHK